MLTAADVWSANGSVHTQLLARDTAACRDRGAMKNRPALSLYGARTEPLSSLAKWHPKEEEPIFRGHWLICPSAGPAPLHRHSWRHTDVSCDVTLETTPKSTDREVGTESVGLSWPVGPTQWARVCEAFQRLSVCRLPVSVPHWCDGLSRTGPSPPPCVHTVVSVTRQLLSRGSVFP